MQIILTQKGSRNRFRKRHFFLFFSAAVSSIAAITPVSSIAATGTRKVSTIKRVGTLINLVTIIVSVTIRIRIIWIGTKISFVIIRQSVSVRVISSATSTVAAIATISSPRSDRLVLNPIWIHFVCRIVNEFQH